jgi:diacylglycerol kinase (ATP)
MLRYKIIANPVAGRGDGTRAEAIIDRVFGRAGTKYDLVETRAPHEAMQLAQLAAEQGYDVAVAVGGDGTVHEVVNGLMAAAQRGVQAYTALGVVPLGTGNDFAWGLGLPENNPEAACHVLLAGHRRTIDLGQVSDERGQSWIFDNMIGAGFDAAVALESHGIRRLRGLMLYLVAGLRALVRHSRCTEVTVCYDGQRITRPLLLLSAANGRRTGGGFLLAPQAQLDDGLLDVTLAGAANVGTILRLLPHFIRGTHASQTRYVTIAKTARLVCEAPGGIPVHLEGEVIRTDARRLEIRALPSCLAVLVPDPMEQKG